MTVGMTFRSGVRARAKDKYPAGANRRRQRAERFKRDILSIQPAGPYYLGGMCEGGIVALEIALQLQQEGRKVAFLARHGRGHRILPTELNFRANIYGFKQLGVERILSISAVGSLKEEHKPLEFVIPDQFYDRTKQRISTFFGDGIVAHVGFGNPVCSERMPLMRQPFSSFAASISDFGPGRL